jgi:hypothetical protein
MQADAADAASEEDVACPVWGAQLSGNAQRRRRTKARKEERGGGEKRTEDRINVNWITEETREQRISAIKVSDTSDAAHVQW